MGSARLGACMKDGVAATNIGTDGMGFADSITSGYSMAITRTTAGEVVFAFGQKSGKDAVFHMKHGNVLVEGEFKPRGWGGVEEFE